MPTLELVLLHTTEYIMYETTYPEAERAEPLVSYTYLPDIGTDLPHDR